jgi:hypothetical protein
MSYVTSKLVRASLVSSGEAHSMKPVVTPALMTVIALLRSACWRPASRLVTFLWPRHGRA